MKVRWPFFLNPGHRWGWFILAVILQFAALGFIGWRWHNIQVDGLPYQWACIPRLEVSSFGTDYVRVVFPQDTAAWQDEAAPKIGQTVYVSIAADDQGLLTVTGASASKPGDGQDYMEAEAVSYTDGQLQFRVPFDRYRVAPELADGIYHLQDTDKIIAKIRIKHGKGVIEGIFVNGVPLESLSNGAAMIQQGQDKQSGFNRPHFVDAGMVPPK